MMFISSNNYAQTTPVKPQDSTKTGYSLGQISLPNPKSIIDGYIIAELELREKKLPFIIRRPIPSGGCEYWNLRDLELITY